MQADVYAGFTMLYAADRKVWLADVLGRLPTTPPSAFMNVASRLSQ